MINFFSSLKLRKLVLRNLLLISLIPLNVFPQWVWQNPLPQGNRLLSVRFADANTGFAVGDLGTILRTTDKGLTWTQSFTGTGIQLWDVFFPDPQIGYVCGGYGSNGGFIYKTIDGGMTWTKMSVEFFYEVHSIWFTDVNTGYVCAWDGLYKTINGGETWTNIYLGTCWGVCFTDSLTGFISIGGYIFKTNDGGDTWASKYYNPTGDNMHSFFFLTHDMGFAVGHGRLLKTTDGGENWSVTEFQDYLNCIFFSTPLIGTIVGMDHLYLTVDGGSTWITQSSPVPDPVWGGAAADSLHSVLVGDHGGMVVSEDAGQNWYAISSYATVNNLWSLFFIGQDVGFASGNNGTIIKTTDGGNIWWSYPSGTNEYLSSLYFTSPNVGYVCGYNSTILKTTNGGTNWMNISPTPGEYDFHKIQFTSQNNGYALSPSALLNTINAGSSWTVKTPPGITASSMVFTSDNTGYICGDSGRIVKTADGGDSYISLNTGITDDLRTIAFPTKYTGFAAGYGPVIKTVDAGNTWEVKYTGTLHPYSYQGMFFPDSCHGYILCYDTILATKDGGETWQINSTGYYYMYPLMGIWFMDSLNGYVAGANGSVFKTTAGGVITGINKIQEAENLQLYPNPNKGQFSIIITKKAPGEIKIYDLMGRKIYQSRFEGNTNVQLVDLNAPRSGIYFVKVRLPDRTLTGKIIINKE